MRPYNGLHEVRGYMAPLKANGYLRCTPYLSFYIRSWSGK